METAIRYNDRAAYQRIEADVLDLIYKHGRVRQNERDTWEFRVGQAICGCVTHNDTVEWLTFAVTVSLHRAYPMAVPVAVRDAAAELLEAARNG